MALILFYWSLFWGASHNRLAILRNRLKMFLSYLETDQFSDPKKGTCVAQLYQEMLKKISEFCNT